MYFKGFSRPTQVNLHLLPTQIYNNDNKRKELPITGALYS